MGPPFQGSSTGAIVQRLKIVASGFRGCGSDDYVVRHVVDRLKAAPHLKRAAVLKKPPNFVAARLGATVAESIGLLGMSFLQDVELAQQKPRVIKDFGSGGECCNEEV